MEAFLAKSNDADETNPIAPAGVAHISRAAEVVFGSEGMLRLQQQVKENTPV